LLTLIVRLVPAWELRNPVHDIPTYIEMSDVILRGDNIYARETFFPYTPFSQFIPAWIALLTGAVHWRFDFASKLPPILADAATTLLIFGYLRQRGLPLGPATGWSLAWALNPVSILVSAFQGNLIATVPFFTLGAYVAAEAAERSPNRDLLVAMSALLLGIGIAMRGYPVLLVPAFLVFCTRTLREALAFTILGALATVSSSLPYLILARQSYLRELLTYNGNTDFGWLSIIRSIPLVLHGGPAVGPFASWIVDASKPLFLLGYAAAALTFPYFRRESFGRALILGFVLFYALFTGLNAQYLVWVVSPGILLRERLALVYSAAATAALLSFYAIYHPAVLFGRFPAFIQESQTVGALYAAGNTLFVLVCLAWIVHILAGELRAYRAGNWWTSVVWVRGLRALWSSPWYSGALLVLVCAWFWQLARTAADTERVLGNVLR
jgi:uncharacterized membrane protein